MVFIFTFAKYVIMLRALASGGGMVIIRLVITSKSRIEGVTVS